MEGHEVVGANLGPVDFCGERRGEVSRRGTGSMSEERGLTPQVSSLDRVTLARCDCRSPPESVT